MHYKKANIDTQPPTLSSRPPRGYHTMLPTQPTDQWVPTYTSSRSSLPSAAVTPVSRRLRASPLPFPLPASPLPLPPLPLPPLPLPPLPLPAAASSGASGASGASASGAVSSAGASSGLPLPPLPLPLPAAAVHTSVSGQTVGLSACGLPILSITVMASEAVTEEGISTAWVHRRPSTRLPKGCWYTSWRPSPSNSSMVTV
mmetsp:Transcript_39675/g.113128  ORF Transcript_39675/g.113128 Transcript_39675/m.113128 type:complete len:201 (+) Transcript_39675:400-1002(+)